MAKKVNNSVNNNETRFVCPNCGAEFAIPEHTSVGIGIMPGKDSNLGTIELELAKGQKKQSKAQKRIEALKAAGVNTSNLVAIELGGTLGETVGRIVDGVISVITDDDPIFNSIIGQGTVPNRRLFRRFVMAQYFHMLLHKGGVTGAINTFGYDYSWRMTVEELRVQAKLVDNDPENFNIRNAWFNKKLIITMASRYLNEILPEYIDGLKIRHCKRREYKRIHGCDYFITDIPTKIFTPLSKALTKINKANNPKKLYEAASEFLSNMVHLSWGTQKDKEWCEAYKGVGAYYTMSNLIQFHGCRIADINDHILSEDDSLAYIKRCNTAYSSHEGWRMLGVLKKLLEDNNIDIEAKIAEWRKAKACK